MSSFLLEFCLVVFIAHRVVQHEFVCQGEAIVAVRSWPELWSRQHNFSPHQPHFPDSKATFVHTGGDPAHFAWEQKRDRTGPQRDLKIAAKLKAVKRSLKRWSWRGNHPNLNQETISVLSNAYIKKWFCHPSVLEANEARFNNSSLC